MMNVFKSNKSKLIGLIALFILLFLVFIVSISVGQTPITVITTIQAFIQYDPSNTEHIIIMTSRISRALIAVVIGACLAIAGTLMQAMTRNPLALPDLLGINAGGLFFIVLSITFLSLNSLTSYMWMGLLGAGIAGVLVFFLGSLGRDGLSPLRIVLAGAAISALFASGTQGLLVIDEQSIQSILFWMAGSVAGRDLNMLVSVFPYLGMAMIVALFLGRPLNILLSGEDVAKGLGQRTVLVKIIVGLVVIMLAGGSVAVAGAIGFIGLIVPHIVKGLIGRDHRWVIPYSALVGAMLLLVADMIARVIIMPQEVPIGVMTAFIGAPFFVYIARKGLKRNA
ncbi:FecCD family ABC transporter permease [Alkalihalobacillus pseudalcaliphilus]|uniref:FecCD family ABC transporter permease n=1 Tax=Alkalihalobacillus pseudalcaliphilus TaxID=79884 RepID=UPI00064D8061|nr:iron ABC transporter permease [Alkalihalobacillus pseudalcaliphilus]KMK75382.1 siderophore ABC transporter permease [Alkalihalobacillus pseudalcaliphilus]